MQLTGQSPLRGELTSAGEREPPVILLIAAGGLLLPVAGTSARGHLDFRLEGITSTSSQRPDVVVPFAEEDRLDTRGVLTHVRRVSGLNWDQLAALFGVSRRSVHFWASGKPMSATNEDKLHRVHAVILAGARASVPDTRTALMHVGEDGVSPLDLLAQERYREASAALGARTRRVPASRTPLSAEAREARRPQPLEERMGALHDRVHQDAGPGRAARSVRNKPRGRS